MKTPRSFHPDVERIARFLPRSPVTPRLLPVIRLFGRLTPSPRQVGGVAIENVRVPGPEGAPDVRLRLYRTPPRTEATAALLWMHGGGFVLGMPEQDDAWCATLAKRLGILVASVDYRLAPEHPFPAPLEDCYAALDWLSREVRSLGVDPTRIAIGGASAGGGLAAQLALMAHDRAEVTPAFQLLVYPMLDDRSAVRADIDGHMHRLWNQSSNVFGWTAYLGRPPGGDDVSEVAAPSRRRELAGLAPAWIGVGTHDLFHDEDVAYAQRLREAGVRCDLEVIEGVFHGFDAIAPRARVVRSFRESAEGALRRALFIEEERTDT